MMADKNIYMVNKKEHAVACLNDLYFVPMLEKMGFVRCSNADYFRWRWGTWNKAKFVYIDRRTNEKNKTVRSN